jgi:hypothetical protein
VRYSELGKLHSIRLDFELRLVNCENERLGSLSFCKCIHVTPTSLEKVNEIVMMKHNVVLTDYTNQDKALYLI